MKVKKLTISIFVLIFMLIAFSGVASANYYNGGVHSATVTGASANITYNSKPAVYNYSMSSAWVAITQSSNTIAQIGWAIDLGSSFGSNPYYFFGYINTDGNYHERYTGYSPAIGSMHNYKITYSTSGTTKTASGYLDDTFYFSQTIDWQPDNSQYAGEIYDYNAQFPGKTSNPEVFSSVRARTPSGVWYTPVLQSYTDSCAGQSGISSQYSTSTFKIWDTRY